MPLVVGELAALLRLDDKPFRAGLSGARSAFADFGATVAKGVAIVGAALGGALLTSGGAAVKLAADLEQSRIAFTTLLGDGEKARAFLDDLAQFAAETPFEVAGLEQSARQLLAFGFEAEQILPMMRSIGDAISALGGGSVEIDRVTRALGQMQAKGKVSAEEMMQLAELGIPAWEMLAEAIGVSIPEAMEMASKGAIDAATGIDAILQGMNARFAGSMQQQSQTVLGLWSTLKDTGALILRDLGTRLIESLDLRSRIQELLGWFEEHRDTIISFITGFIEKTGELASTVWSLVQYFRAVVEDGDHLNDWLTHLPEPIRGVVEAIGGFIASMVETGEGARGLLATVAPIWEQIKGIILRAVEAIRLIWAEWGDEIMAVARTVFGTVWQVIQNALGIVTGILDAFIGLFTGDWQRMADGLKAIWENLWEGIRAIVSGAWNILKTAFGGLWDSISKWFTDLWEDAKGWGRDVIEGFLDGIRGMIDEAKRKVAGWISSITASVKDVLGIRSPSRVFEDIGLNIGEGLAAGLESARSIVERAAAGALVAPTLRLPVAPAMAGAPAAAAAAGGYRTANIVIELDGRAVANIVGQHLVDELRLRTPIR